MNWILKLVIDEILVKGWAMLKPWLDKMIWIQKEKKIDNKNIDQLKKDQNADTQTKIKDETNLLNGNDSKP